MRIKRLVRRTIGPQLQWWAYRTGAMRLSRIFSPRGGAIVLMYHSVADSGSARWIDPGNHVPAEVFARQMNFLVQQRSVISLHRLMEIIGQGRTPEEGSVVITFDDGYLDNLTVAGPILRDLNLPATVFLPTGYIDRGENQWIDQAYSSFRYRTNARLVWRDGSRYDLGAESERSTAYRVVCNALLGAGLQERQELLDGLQKQLDPAEMPPRLTMTWEDVRALSALAPGVTFGGHSIEHTDLSGIPLEDARLEISGSMQAIKVQTGLESTHMSFCYGRSSDELREMLPALGIEAAFSSGVSDRLVKTSVNPYKLPRVTAPASMERFPLAVSTANTGIWQRLGR